MQTGKTYNTTMGRVVDYIDATHLKPLEALLIPFDDDNIIRPPLEICSQLCILKKKTSAPIGAWKCNY